ncbi:MAG TPA: AAA family ATPase, partial [Candidatus Kapabacteria bacterium]|nr:AAA family ATPase [Candidatus Kapabacteria bacterium]
MWYLEEIEITNFKSHIHTKLVLNQNKTTLVYAVNEDDKGADSNGAGKSSIIEAIDVLLLDTFGKDLNQEDFINDKSSFSIIRGVLNNNVFSKKLEIERKYSRNKTSVCELRENGVLLNQLVSVAEKNKYIIDSIGISKADILNYFIINQENSNSFFMASDGDKKEIIARFTNSNMVDKLIGFVDEDLNIVNNSIESNNEEIQKINTFIESLEEQLIYEKEQRKQEYVEEVNNLKEQINKINIDLQNDEKKCLDKLEELNIKQKQLGSFSVNIGDELVFDKKIGELKEQIKMLREQKGEVVAISDDLERKIKGKIVCPKCNHSWTTLDKNADLGLLESALNDCVVSIKEYELTIKNKKDKIEKFEKQVEDIKLSKKKKKSTEETIQLLINTTSYLKNNVDLLKTQLLQSKQKIEKIKDFKENTIRIRQLQAEIKTKKGILGTFLEKNKELEEQKKNYEFWKINFGNLGFKTYLINQTLSMIESLINSYLYKFNINIQVKINGFKVLKSQEIREKIDVLVSKDGQKWSKFRKFSGGQRKRINICGILALQSLINSASPNGGLNLLLLDETFESLDASGQEELLRILNLSKMTILLISHQNNDLKYKENIYNFIQRNINNG